MPVAAYAVSPTPFQLLGPLRRTELSCRVSVADSPGLAAGVPRGGLSLLWASAPPSLPALFSSETIMFLHQIFYQGLKARISSWPTLVLGESPSPPPPSKPLFWATLQPRGPSVLPEWHRVAPSKPTGSLGGSRRRKTSWQKLFLGGSDILLVPYLLFPFKNNAYVPI